jgi:tRNA-specific adenosine deaminase 3
VVVDPSIDTTESSWQQGIVAGAGDARYCAPGVDTSQLDLDGSYNPDIEGGPELHATMRAIEMIASLRRAGEHIASAATTTTTTITNDNPQIHKPRLTPLETQYLRSSFPSSSPPSKRRKPDNSSQLTDEQTPAAATDDRVVSRSPQAGYLCTDLDIYITHEPCLSCSMGILLSRFRAVIFSRRGRLKTGGLASEPVCDGDQRPYYGLHWRKELNWRALCFEFVEDGEGNGDWKNQELVEDGLEFHA